MPPGRNEAALEFAIKELATEIKNLREAQATLVNDRFASLLKQAEKNEELIRANEATLQLLPSEIDKSLRELIDKEFSSERSLEMARKILDGLRQGMHLFLGGTLSRTGAPAEDSGVIPTSAFPARPPNPYTLAAKKEESTDGDGEESEPPGRKRRDLSASFSIYKDGKIEASVDRNSRLALAAGIVAAIAAIGWMIQAIVNVVHH